MYGKNFKIILAETEAVLVYFKNFKIISKLMC